MHTMICTMKQKDGPGIVLERSDTHAPSEATLSSIRKTGGT